MKINPPRLKRLLENMIDIYSPSGKENELCEFLAAYLHEHGLPVTLREVGESRRNIEVVFSDSPPDIAFLGHIDTVPAFDIDRYEFSEADGIVHGLGSADMKSGCAALVEAFIATLEDGRTPENAGLFLVVGEEETGDGTAALLEARSFPWAVVAEPTELIPCLAHYGYLEMLVRAFGTRRHASMAGKHYNAIMSMLRTLLRLGEFVESRHPTSILNIRDIHSSEAGFAVPGSCEAGIDLHIPPESPPEDIAEEMSALVKDALSGDNVTRYEAEFTFMARGYRLEDRGRLPRWLAEVYADLARAWRPGAFQSHSDANLLHADGCKPVILGPGQLSKAHTRDECVALNQVEEAAAIYFGLLEKISREPGGGTPRDERGSPA